MRKEYAAALWIAGTMYMNAATKITQGDFGKMPGGAAIRIFTLANQKGVEARITNYGGIVVSLKTPDRNGTSSDVVLGFDALSGYIANPGPFFGALVGRYANRIAHAKFTLDGVEYKLEKNDGDNTLHGGSHGLDKAVWTPRELPDGGLELSVASKDGDEGFPRQPEGHGGLSSDRCERAEDRLFSHHGQSHGGQPHQSLVLQFERRGAKATF